jgi:hypothetical protein
MAWSLITHRDKFSYPINTIGVNDLNRSDFLNAMMLHILQGMSSNCGSEKYYPEALGSSLQFIRINARNVPQIWI